MKPLPEAVQRAFPCAPDRLRERPWHTDMTSAKAAAHDSAHPLPHPGYRAGQVWAQEDGSSATICATYTHPNAHVICIGKAQFREETVARIYPYLMADPACPHLAPWSPAEAKP